jgi:uncharacterized protein YbaR (Trm112 family)
MGFRNGVTERYCSECKKWYEVEDSEGLFTCPHCERKQRIAKCNRCGYEWRLHRTRYPDNCPSCKNPYFNTKRTQTRKETAKLYIDKVKS